MTFPYYNNTLQHFSLSFLIRLPFLFDYNLYVQIDFTVVHRMDKISK